MAGDHAAKKGSPKKERASGMPRSAGKKVKTLPVEELSPERRSEIAQEAEAKQCRGKSPSTDGGGRRFLRVTDCAGSMSDTRGSRKICPVREPVP